MVLKRSFLCTGLSTTVQIKPEPETNRTGPTGPHTARTPGPKAGPATANMVSPAVQMQIKLLPAVHSHSIATAAAEAGASKPNTAAGSTMAGGAGMVPGLPKPRPAGASQGQKQAAAAATHPKMDNLILLEIVVKKA